MRFRASALIGVAIVLGLALWSPAPSVAAPGAAAPAANSAPASCGAPCHDPVTPGSSSPAASTPTPTACVQATNCGGGGAMTLGSVGALLVAFAGLSLATAARRVLMCRPARDRRHPPTGVGVRLLRPPQFA